MITTKGKLTYISMCSTGNTRTKLIRDKAKDKAFNSIRKVSRTVRSVDALIKEQRNKLDAIKARINKV